MCGWNSTSRLMSPTPLEGWRLKDFWALLTGLMVLLFLRDWRSALIVVTTFRLRYCPPL